MASSTGSSSSQTAPFDDAAYKTILILAENYRTASPPQIRECIHCLISVLHMKPPPPPEVLIRIHYQLGCLAMRHANSYDLAISHLQNSIAISQQMHDENSLYEAVSALAECFIKNSKLEEAKKILNDAISASQHVIYWHVRLIFQLTKLYHEQNDFTSACQLLDHGSSVARNCGLNYLRILFLLSKGMVLLIQQNLTEVNKVLSMCGQLIDDVQNASKLQVQSLKVFFLTLQVAHLLSGGQVKSVKSSLKMLQQSMQEISAFSEDECVLIKPKSINQAIFDYEYLQNVIQKLMSMDAFTWLPREYMYVLVYLATVTHSMLAGYMEKAQKYTDKALTQLEALKKTDKNPLLTRLELMFHENMAQCHLVMSDKRSALFRITKACKLCHQHSNVPQIMNHTTQIHTLLGMYSMNINSLKDAGKQLKLAVDRSLTSEQYVTNLLNLALVHMHSFQFSNGKLPHIKHQELVQVLSRISPDSNALKSRNLKASLYFVKGMFSFFQSLYNESKRYLHEALKISNQQDLNRITAMSLVLLAHVHYALGDSRESLEKVNIAMDIARKMPDPSVQLWAASLLRDLHSSWGEVDNAHQYKQMYEQLENFLNNDNSVSSSLPQQDLIKWVDDPMPPSHLIELPCKDDKKIFERSLSSTSSASVKSHHPPPIPQPEIPPVITHNSEPCQPKTDHVMQNKLSANVPIESTVNIPESMDIQNNHSNIPKHQQHQVDKSPFVAAHNNQEIINDNNIPYANHHRKAEILPKQISKTPQHQQQTHSQQQQVTLNTEQVLPEYPTRYIPQQQSISEAPPAYTNQKMHHTPTGMYHPPVSHLQQQQSNNYTSSVASNMASPTQYSSPLNKSANPASQTDRNAHLPSQVQQHYNSVHHSNQSVIDQQQDIPTYDASTFYHNTSPGYNPHGMVNSGMQGSSLSQQHNLDHLSRTSHLQQSDSLFVQQSHLQAQHQLKNLQPNDLTGIDHMKHLKSSDFIHDHSLLGGLSQHSQQQMQQQMYLSHQMQLQRQGVAMQNMYTSNNLLPQHNLGIGYPSLGSKFQMPPGLNPQQQQAWLTGQNYGHTDGSWS